MDSEKIQTVVGGSVVGIAKVVNDRFDPNSPGVMSPQGRVVESVQAVNNSVKTPSVVFFFIFI